MGKLEVRQRLGPPPHSHWGKEGLAFHSTGQLADRLRSCHAWSCYDVPERASPPGGGSESQRRSLRWRASSAGIARPSIIKRATFRYPRAAGLRWLSHPHLRTEVINRLKARWSREQIAGRLLNDDVSLVRICARDELRIGWLGIPLQNWNTAP